VPQLPEIPNYSIKKKFGKGAMGTVYLAFQEKLERDVALKVLLPSLAEDLEITQRFLTEAKIGAQLQHNNIVSIYDVGEFQGNYYFAMEYLERSLKDVIKSSKEGRLNPEIALDILKQIASGLEYAHQKGVIHRDVKPANILLRNDGTPVLVDFGIAKLMESDAKLTKTGTSIGTPHYMSPEQIQGMEIDGRSDIYSLGVVFFEMLQGQTPYQGTDSIVIAVKHVKDPVPRLDSQLSQYQSIIDRMMAKDKRDRFQGGSDLINSIQKMQLNQLSPEKEITVVRKSEKKNKTVAYSESESKPKRSAFSRWKQSIYSSIVVLVLILGIAGISMLKKSESDEETIFWHLAEKKDSLEAYNQYLAEYPRGKYAANAREKLSNMEADTREQEKAGIREIETGKNPEFHGFLEQAHQALVANDLTRAMEMLGKAKKIMTTPELLELEKKISLRQNHLKPAVRLRKAPTDINTNRIQSMLESRGFFDYHKNRNKRFRNLFSLKKYSGQTVVVDRTTALMWHHMGSDRYMSLPVARNWISRLNRKRYAGYSDWRLPTLEEAASLMEAGKNASGLHLNPVFSGKTRSIWTSDTNGKQYWIVYFDHGFVDVNWPQFNGYVRPVRTIY
jgi:serine/threonine protein kinase